MIEIDDAVRVVGEIAGLDAERKITSDQAGYIGELFNGDKMLFRELDEKPGLYASSYYHNVEGDYTYNSWHWKLRQARNYDEFWDALNK